MFSIFNRSSRRSAVDLSVIQTDMHSHLLPGIDDGSPDTETSILLLKGLQDLGLQNFITTPHILWDLYRNDDDSIERSELLFKEAAAQQNLVLPIRSAAEYMMDDHFSEQVRKKHPLRRISGNYVLVEFSFVSLPYEWKETLFALQIQGYQPILAHPERYNFLGSNTAIFEQIVDMGVLLQVNLNSLTGYYGKPAYSLAKFLIKNKLVSLLGTDCHHQRHLDALRESGQLMDHVKEVLDSGKLINASL